MEENSLGRLIRTLSEKCPKCNHVLQFRARANHFVAGGIDRLEEEEYISCSNCDYEREIKEVKKRKERFDKTATPFVDERRNEKNDRHKERGGTKNSSGERDRKSFRGHNR